MPGAAAGAACERAQAQSRGLMHYMWTSGGKIMLRIHAAGLPNSVRTGIGIGAGPL